MNQRGRWIELGEERRRAANVSLSQVSEDRAPPSGYLDCCVCHAPIKGVIVEALSKTWHPEHFTCTLCNEPIKGQKFNVRDGKPYCEQDFAQLFLKRCFSCNLPIRDIVVVALDKSWHRDHFVCTTCGAKLASKGFFEKEGNPFCQSCFEERFCTRCHHCSKPITDTAVFALGEKWHQSCFMCKNCQLPIHETTFDIIQGKPFCSSCISEVAKEMDRKL